MLTRRSTVALVFLLAVGTAQAHAVATRTHQAAKHGTAHSAGSVFKLPVLAQLPLHWGRILMTVPPLELISTPAGSFAPGLTLTPVPTSTVIASARANVFSVPLLAQSPLNWGRGAAVLSPGLPSPLIGTTGSGLAVARSNLLELVSPLSGGTADSSSATGQPPVDDAADAVTDLRDALVQLAMSLRDIPYVSGGDTPSTGFDCSGFVRYVFAHAIGMQLPANAASQFVHGLKVTRGRLKTGDLVFFHTSGKRRISHVGIYLSNGRFIHAPTTGKSVEVSSLHESYWSRHFAGAKRPAAIVAAATNG